MSHLSKHHDRTATIRLLHDATVLELRFYCDATHVRHIAIRVACDDDAGYAAWNGQQVLVELQDVGEANYQMVGSMADPETIDHWEIEAAGPEAAPFNQQPTSQTLRALSPRYQCNITFHSGSKLTGMCAQIVATVVV
jgi:hypothetical protein